MNRAKVFVSYSHDDVRWKHEISKQLEVLEKENLLELWCDTDIGPGEDWHEVIDRSLQAAKAAILVISASFLTSDFILDEEVPRLLDQNHQEGMELIPILVSDCDWQAVKWLADKQLRPRDARPISELPKARRTRELAEIAREVRELLNTSAAGPGSDEMR